MCRHIGSLPAGTATAGECWERDPMAAIQAELATSAARLLPAIFVQLALVSAGHRQHRWTCGAGDSEPFPQLR